MPAINVEFDDKTVVWWDSAKKNNREKKFDT
jgi:hypothetical protein